MKSLIVLLLLSFNAQAFEIETESPLEKHTPIENDLEGVFNKRDLPLKTDATKILKYMTPARSQGKRGTCTMFTSIGMVEYILNRYSTHFNKDINLSEEWMEYIIMTKKTTEGSSTSKNIKAILAHGVTHEKTWPYLGQKWFVDYEAIPQAKKMCGHLEGDASLLKSCQLGHRDPRLLGMNLVQINSLDPKFAAIKKEAYSFRDKFIKKHITKKNSYKLKKLSQVKALLAKGTPVIMGMKLYYGSWNSSKTEKLNIQTRDKSAWYQGVVGYPAGGTKDRRISGVKGGGHSVILVGYDDTKIVNTRMQMEDGSWKEFSYQGVYYFKNSWGQKGNGRDFRYKGKSYKGHGMITQKYAHEFGSFFHVPVK